MVHYGDSACLLQAERGLLHIIQRSRGILVQGAARLPDFIQERLGQAR
jgi:hypothetical protein